MNVILAAVVFIAQMICCMTVKHKLWKFAPTLLVAALMSVTVLRGSLGELTEHDLMGLSIETMLLFAGAFAAVLHQAIKIIWGRMKDRK